MATYLLDTNVLLRSADDRSEHFELALGAVRALLAKADTLCIVPQNLYEFWVVATRPASANGLGWDTARVRREVTALTASFALLPDMPQVFDLWLELVTLHNVQGKQVHDARLVAAMREHGVERLLTLNGEDFKRYPDVEAIHPAEVAS